MSTARRSCAALPVQDGIHGPGVAFRGARRTRWFRHTVSRGRAARFNTARKIAFNAPCSARSLRHKAIAFGTAFAAPRDRVGASPPIASAVRRSRCPCGVLPGILAEAHGRKGDRRVSEPQRRLVSTTGLESPRSRPVPRALPSKGSPIVLSVEPGVNRCLGGAREKPAPKRDVVGRRADQVGFGACSPTRSCETHGAEVKARSAMQPRGDRRPPAEPKCPWRDAVSAKKRKRGQVTNKTGPR